ncbi:hypothetical protein GCM10027448_10350 [Nocardioides dilutus]
MDVAGNGDRHRSGWRRGALRRQLARRRTGRWRTGRWRTGGFRAGGWRGAFPLLNGRPAARHHREGGGREQGNRASTHASMLAYASNDAAEKRGNTLVWGLRNLRWCAEVP